MQLRTGRLCIVIFLHTHSGSKGADLGAVQLREVGPGRHGIEVWLGVHQLQHCLTRVTRQGWAAPAQHCDHPVCLAMPACSIAAALVF